MYFLAKAANCKHIARRTQVAIQTCHGNLLYSRGGLISQLRCACLSHEINSTLNCHKCCSELYSFMIILRNSTKPDIYIVTIFMSFNIQAQQERIIKNIFRFPSLINQKIQHCCFLKQANYLYWYNTQILFSPNF